MNRSFSLKVPSIIARLSFALLGLAMAGFLLAPMAAGGLPAVCQEEGLDKAAVQQLLDELDDIDLMRSLTPLKLTGEQIDKLVSTISDAQTAYDKKIAELNSSTIGKMADEIHKRHKDAVSGAAASKAFDDKVKALIADSGAKREKVNTDNLVQMTGACGKIVTADQKKIAAQLEKDTFAKLGRPMSKDNKDDQYFNQYVVDIFINYRRIVPLLKAMKSAAQ